MSNFRCKVCGKEITACKEKGECTSEFCSWECQENQKSKLKKKLQKAIKNDKGHTEGFSK